LDHSRRRHPSANPVPMPGALRPIGRCGGRRSLFAGAKGPFMRTSCCGRVVLGSGRAGIMRSARRVAVATSLAAGSVRGRYAGRVVGGHSRPRRGGARDCLRYRLAAGRRHASTLLTWGGPWSARSATVLRPRVLSWSLALPQGRSREAGPTPLSIVDAEGRLVLERAPAVPAATWLRFPDAASVGAFIGGFIGEGAG